MSTASISYSSLKDASNEAKSVAKKLDKYADYITGLSVQNSLATLMKRANSIKRPTRFIALQH